MSQLNLKHSVGDSSYMFFTEPAMQFSTGIGVLATYDPVVMLALAESAPHQNASITDQALDEALPTGDCSKETFASADPVSRCPARPQYLVALYRYE